MKHFDVAIACNEVYAFPASVMMRSLRATLEPEQHVKFHVLTSGMPSHAWKRVARCADAYGYDVREVVVDPSSLGELKVDGHVTIETYYRLLLPQLFQDLERILYLDSDMIVCRTVAPLFNESMADALVLAVPLASPKSGFFGAPRGIPSFSRLGIPGSTRTFNAGLLMIDLAGWRLERVAERVLRYLNEYREHVLWWDQDGLNAVLHNRWRSLDAAWNVMTSHVAEWRSWQDSLLDPETYATVLRAPRIIHYSNVSKPWMPTYAGPFLDAWRAAAAPLASFFGSSTFDCAEPRL